MQYQDKLDDYDMLEWHNIHKQIIYNTKIHIINQYMSKNLLTSLFFNWWSELLYSHEDSNC